MTDKRLYTALAALCVICSTVLLSMGNMEGGLAVLGLGGTVAGRGR